VQYRCKFNIVQKIHRREERADNAEIIKVHEVE
jgi:hypothetical protein